MAWDLATAKKYLGLTGDPTDPADADIQAVMDTTLATVETHLGRKLLRGREVHKEQHVTGNQIFCYRYPIERIDLLDGEVFDDTHPDFTQVGFFSGEGIIFGTYFPGQEVIDIEYTGGYDPLPLDLERVLWEAFMALWSATDAATGGPPESGTGLVGGSGDMKSITVFDAFKIDYDVGVTAAGGSSDGSVTDDNYWGWLAPWAAVLSFYRRGFAGNGLGIA